MTRPDQARTLQDRARRLDLASLVAGLLALGVAALYLSGELSGHEVQVGAVAAYAVGVLAVSGLLAGLRRALVDRSG